MKYKVHHICWKIQVGTKNYNISTTYLKKLIYIGYKEGENLNFIHPQTSPWSQLIHKLKVGIWSDPSPPFPCGELVRNEIFSYKHPLCSLFLKILWFSLVQLYLYLFTDFKKARKHTQWSEDLGTGSLRGVILKKVLKIILVQWK